jgi:outer membrane protein OmpA-like peptidoglycan-associated protein
MINRKNGFVRGRLPAAVTVTVFAIVSAAGCASPGKRTAIGAGGGALAGAGLGALIGGKKGALIGAALGAGVGAGVGNYLDKQAQELEKVAETKRTEQGVLVNFKGDLLFESGSAALKPAAIDQVSQVGAILAKYSEDHVKIEGHTDNVGAVSINEELSKRRADAVREVLLSKGVQPTQMLVLGAGKARPVADNRTAAGRAKNRRVEVYITVPQEGGETKRM